MKKNDELPSTLVESLTPQFRIEPVQDNVYNVCTKAASDAFTNIAVNVVCFFM